MEGYGRRFVMSQERLFEIKSQVSEAKQEKAKVAGQIIQVDGQMLSKFKVKNLDESNKRLNDIATKLGKMENKFDVGMEKLESAHDWE